MKRTIVLGVVLLLVGASGAQALKWEVYASLSTRVIPGQGLNTSKAIATSFHRTLLTEVTVLDTVFPTQLRVAWGDILWDGNPVAGCYTQWIWASNAITASCVANFIEQDCGSSTWEALTTGQVRYHPAGGWKTNYSGPQFTNCSCM